MIIKSGKREEFIDITALVEKEVDESGVKKGLINIFLPHASAGLIINENADPNILVDLQKKINELIPLHDGYLHDRIDNNAAAHIKSSFFRPEFTLQIIDGKLQLGRWQNIMLAEFDGPKQRNVQIMIIPA